MKGRNFKGCVKSKPGKKEKIKAEVNSDEPEESEVKEETYSSKNSGFDKALNFFKKGDSLEAIKSTNKFLDLNPNSKEGYVLSALINIYGLSNFDEAIDDINIAIDIDNAYAYSHALKASVFYFGLGGSFSESLKYLQAGLKLSPEDPYVNFIAGDIQFDNGFAVLGGDTFDLDKKPKNKKTLSLKSFENAKNNFEKTLANINLDRYKNPLAESSYTLDATYTTTALLGDTKLELYFLYKDINEKSKAKQYLEEALEHYSKAISIAPTQEEVEKLELDKDLNLISPADVYRARGNVYSWMNSKSKKACSDWKVAKKLGDEGARDNFRNFKC
jgi:tetratricopeptide (TPR) repeat protein